MGSSETSVENPSHSRELIQNATLPVPSGEMGCGNIFNTSNNFFSLLIISFVNNFVLYQL